MMEPNNLVGGARIRVMFVVALCLLCSLANAASEYRPPAKVPPVGIGFRGDGGGYFPDAKIPVEFGDEKNLLWKAPLVNWSWSSPVPVGNRVLMMAEPTWSGALWPQLCCYDADTGERLWVVDVNPLDAFPELTEEERTAITADFRWWYDSYNVMYRETYPLIAAGKSLGPDDPELRALNERLAPGGRTLGRFRLNYGPFRSMNVTPAFQQREKVFDKRIRKLGLHKDKIGLGQRRGRSGISLATPVTDGTRVWVKTTHGTVACFDFDGNRRWSRCIIPSKGHENNYLRSCQLSSPRLWDDQVIVDFYTSTGFKKWSTIVTALDRKSGAPAWSHVMPMGNRCDVQNIRGSRAGGSLQIMTLGETPILLSGFGFVIRLRDGRLFARGLPSHLATAAVDDERDIVYGAGSHDQGSSSWGLALKEDGDELAMELRWVRPASTTSSWVFGAGKLFTADFLRDPETGAWWIRDGNNPGKNAAGLVLAEKPASRKHHGQLTMPQNRRTLLVTQQHVYGLVEKRPKQPKGADKAEHAYGLCQVFTHDGRKVAENRLSSGPWDDAQ